MGATPKVKVKGDSNPNKITFDLFIFKLCLTTSGWGKSVNPIDSGCPLFINVTQVALDPGVRRR